MTGNNGRLRDIVGTLRLLAGGCAGAALLTLLHVPAGALIGSVLGAMAMNKLTDEVVRRRKPGTSITASLRGLPGSLRVVGQALLGVMAGARLGAETLRMLALSAVPVILSVIALLGVTMLLARYLIRRHGVDPLTAVMAAAPGGVSELAIAAQRRGAVMHVVLSIHLFRVLVVVLIALPLLLLAIGI
jgi:membrane AbrB-like protein